MTALPRENALPRADRDDDLVEALQHEAPAAPELLISRYGDRAYRLALGILGDAADAGEAVQDAFERAVREVERFDGELPFATWLCRLVAAACDRLQDPRDGRGDIALDDVLPTFGRDGRHVAPVVDWSVGLEDPERARGVRRALSAALERLPADHRAALVLRDVEGCSHREVADVLSLSVPEAKARVHRARLFLRQRLAERAL